MSDETGEEVAWGIPLSRSEDFSSGGDYIYAAGPVPRQVERTPLNAEASKERMFWTMFSAGSWMFLASIATVIASTVLWLKDGVWPDWSFGTIWYGLGGQYPDIDWQGVEKIALWVLQQPFYPALMVGGIGLCWLGSLTAE